MKCQYVFYWNPEEYYRIAFGDILASDQVHYYTSVLEKRYALEKINMVLFSDKVNKIAKIPFKAKWNDIYFNNIQGLKKGFPTRVVFHGSYYWMKSSGYFEYLKELNDFKIVMILMDTIESYKKYFKNKYYGDFDVNYIKNTFDLVLTYNKIDADNYGIQYYPSIYSRTNVDFSSPNEHDVFFVGKAKDRLDMLHDTYKTLNSKGFKCDFYITDVPEDKKKYPDIHYNEKLSYQEVINKVITSNGILEIVQQGSNGFTLRLDEALVYDRNIITNNPIVNLLEYRTSKKIYSLNTIDSIDIQEFRETSKLSFQYLNDYSPTKLLMLLDNLDE